MLREESATLKHDHGYESCVPEFGWASAAEHNDGKRGQDQTRNRLRGSQAAPSRYTDGAVRRPEA
jgi:hypothetical protein